VIQLAPGDGRLAVRFPEGWLDDNPLTRADIEQESRYLGHAGLKLDVA
jgi:exopolyphosphatase/guanosine-5'-triphosphate,3'-diphosphate pyrophosphatase